MAQWSRANRTLYAKIVYYGPAFGGKTTNLQTLHRITDPRNKEQMLSVKTADDRTLFFDLLPFDLGDILGYQVAMKLYTVPGQVRYDTTRQIVLAGADAIVFVADSTASRKEQNIWSLQNLQMNMRAKGLDPARVPILYQYNKQDLPEAASPDEVASWLGIPVEQGISAVAVTGRGVLDTFMTGSRTMLERLIGMADDRTRRGIDMGELRGQIERAFAPYMSRREDLAGNGALSSSPRPGASAEERLPIVVDDSDLLERAVQTGVNLGEKLSHATARANRLEQEAEAFRRLSESLHSVGASFDRHRIIDAALEATGQVLEASTISLIHEPLSGQPMPVRIWGGDEDPLLRFAAGRDLILRMISASGPCVVDDLSAECPGPEAARHLDGLRAVAAVPVEADGVRVLLAYAPQPDGGFREQDVRFLATVASHLSAGIEKSRLHEALARHRDRLEETVTARTEQLRVAYESLRSLDQMKDRFLSNLSHEMKTPLTAILSSGVVLRDYDSSRKEREELSETIVDCAETMQSLLDDLFRLVNLEAEGSPVTMDDVNPEKVVEHAVELAGNPPVKYRIQRLPPVVAVDSDKLARALANLIDNAVKFSPSDSAVEIEFEPFATAGMADGMRLSVLDRGSGVAEDDHERIFHPFEQGGDPMTAKPPGIGLGLHEARAIARSLGGDLSYRAREGGGSEFSMTLPILPGTRAPELDPVHVQAAADGWPHEDHDGERK